MTVVVLIYGDKTDKRTAIETSEAGGQPLNPHAHTSNVQDSRLPNSLQDFDLNQPRGPGRNRFISEVIQYERWKNSKIHVLEFLTNLFPAIYNLISRVVQNNIYTFRLEETKQWLLTSQT
jgi:hypothetical protein